MLNPVCEGRDIREAFKTAKYQVLLVANKFQTGFDQPLLCGMYVDRRLGRHPGSANAIAAESCVLWPLWHEGHHVCS